MSSFSSKAAKRVARVARTLNASNASHADLLKLISDDSRRLVSLPLCQTHAMKSKKRCFSEDPLLNSTSVTSSSTSNSMSSSFQSQDSVNISTHVPVVVDAPTYVPTYSPAYTADTDTMDAREKDRASPMTVSIIPTTPGASEKLASDYNDIRRALGKEYLRLPHSLSKSYKRSSRRTKL